MGIGAPRRESILVQEGNIVSWQELAALKDQGAVGDINLRYFDDRGQRVSSDLDNRVIGLTLDEIKKIDHVVGVAGGAEKFKAIRAALKGKLANVLITDHMTAQRLLKVMPSRSLASSNLKQGHRLRSSPGRSNQEP
jgi:DNA-binding transcriptional regulator LsrR (DeoR family)